MKLAGEYLGEEILIYLLMGTYLRHIGLFWRQYDKACVNDPLFGTDFMDCIDKRVQVFLKS